MTACATGVGETPLPGPTASTLEPLVSASGEVVPERKALLSVSLGGIVEQVLVKEGDRVQAGQVLVRQQGAELQKARVSAAEFELMNARSALEALNKDTDVLAARALRSVEIAERALEDLNNPEMREALVRLDVAAAEKTALKAESDLEILTGIPGQQAIEQAYANMLLAENKLEMTLDQIEDVEWQLKKYAHFPSVKRKLARALEGLEFQRSLDQLAHNNSRTRYNNLLLPPDPVDVEAAEAEFRVAKETLKQAERELARVMAGPKPGDVAVLEAQIENGYQDYARYSTGPDPDDIRRAEARLSNAEAQLAAARQTLEELELDAPFDGTITDVHIRVGEWAMPGSPVLQLADLGYLQVKTTNLDEREATMIGLGDPVIVTFDALPGVEVDGMVARIVPMPVPGFAVNYPVFIDLEEIPEGLRWGMSANVDIEFEY